MTDLPPSIRTSSRAWYTLAILVVIMLFNNMDRYVLAVLVQPIKQELGLSDTQIGLLTGFAFSAFYAAVALPVARISDSGGRHAVLWVSMLVWSVMTALCGAAQSFIHLLGARFMVGAGESGAVPASQSLICDVFPPQRRNTAMALLVSGGGVGVFLAFALGGLLEQRIGWRLTFPAVGLPCLLVMLLFVATVRDPQKERGLAYNIFSAESGSSFRLLLSNRIFCHLALGTGFLAFLQLGVPQWLPAFLERSHDMVRAEIGPKLALTSSVGMMAGYLIGGPLADLLARRHPLWPAKIILIAALSAVVPMVGMLISDNERLVLTCIAASAVAISMPAGLIFALTQSVVAPNQRATAAAGSIIAFSFIGLGALPFATGLLSDLFAADFGPHSLRWALLCVVLVTAAPMGFFFSRALTLLGRRQDQTGDLGRAPSADGVTEPAHSRI